LATHKIYIFYLKAVFPRGSGLATGDYGLTTPEAGSCCALVTAELLQIKIIIISTLTLK
jgi:hypothetical protein